MNFFQENKFYCVTSKKDTFLFDSEHYLISTGISYKEGWRNIRKSRMKSNGAYIFKVKSGSVHTDSKFGFHFWKTAGYTRLKRRSHECLVFYGKQSINWALITSESNYILLEKK